MLTDFFSEEPSENNWQYITVHTLKGNLFFPILLIDFLIISICSHDLMQGEPFTSYRNRHILLSFIDPGQYQFLLCFTEFRYMEYNFIIGEKHNLIDGNILLCQICQNLGSSDLSGMGELHLDIIIDRLRREFKVECNQGRPQVTYKEAITKPVELRETFKKQTGGRGKYADIIVRIEPVDEGFEGNLQFVDEVKGGNVPKEYIPSVQKGFQTAMKNGVLAGYPVEQLKVTLLDGSFHPVDSDQLSFELCAIQAFKHGSEKAGPVLMEPIMKIEVVTPEESMGDVIGDLNKRRGQVEGMETSRSGARIVKAKAPLAEMFGYVTALRTITSGRATSTMTFSHYDEVSNSIARNVLTEVQGRVDLLK